MKTIRVTTSAGTSASTIGEVYAAYDGVSWRNSVDRCDCHGYGRVFLDCDDDVADFVIDQLDEDDEVIEYDILD